MHRPTNTTTTAAALTTRTSSGGAVYKCESCKKAILSETTAEDRAKKAACRRQTLQKLAPITNLSLQQYAKQLRECLHSPAATSSMAAVLLLLLSNGHVLASNKTGIDLGF